MNALFVDHLTVMDFSYADPLRGIVGESWIVDVVLHGELDEQGMVFDFGLVKKHLKQSIDQHCDHRLLLPESLPQLEQKSLKGERTRLSWQDQQGRDFVHIAPADATLVLPVTAISPTAMAPVVRDHLLAQLPNNVTALDIRLRPEAINGAFYHYSHGLKKHQGNCQRIAHGHRSAIEIYLDGQRHSDLEASWARQWQDIYIGSRGDLTETFSHHGVDYYRFAYQAQQGRFELVLPAKQCYLIDSDSTVELIATHLANCIAASHPGRHIQVKAFEGVWKGALAEPEA